MRIATVFSGVGAIEQACKNFYGKENVEIVNIDPVKSNVVDCLVPSSERIFLHP